MIQNDSKSFQFKDFLKSQNLDFEKFSKKFILHPIISEVVKSGKLLGPVAKKIKSLIKSEKEETLNTTDAYVNQLIKKSSEQSRDALFQASFSKVWIFDRFF